MKIKKLSFSTERLRGIRLKKKMTQMDLAIKTGLSLVTIGNIERGIKEPRISTISKIAKALGVPITSLLE